MVTTNFQPKIWFSKSSWISGAAIFSLLTECHLLAIATSSLYFPKTKTSWRTTLRYLFPSNILTPEDFSEPSQISWSSTKIIHDLRHSVKPTICAGKHPTAPRLQSLIDLRLAPITKKTDFTMATTNGNSSASPVLKAVHAMSRGQGEEKKVAFAFLQNFQKSVSDLYLCADSLTYWIES